MKKLAVIIKHPFRDFDYRVDLFEVPEDYTNEQLYTYCMNKMLGPFKIIAITERVSNRELKLTPAP